MPNNDVPPPAINIKEVDLNFIFSGANENNMEVGLTLIADYGSFAGKIELLATSPDDPSKSSMLALKLTNNKNYEWALELPGIVENWLQPLMGWTGSAPGSQQQYTHGIPDLILPRADTSLPEGEQHPWWKLHVTGTLYGKHVDTLEAVEIDVAHAIGIGKPTVEQMKTWN